ncbi:unnamed protein product [Spirodela intermedia]|uniref:Uncharacterized protein n=1 Tax=Spirodela intermedia TaxID=51605 RepID=A0A7I8ID14_SPIIN|nr:unnamed protein product [Spirodela intermedia]CAA6655274.1 unnamed protein product [Spirodela intermedia]
MKTIFRRRFLREPLRRCWRKLCSSPWEHLRWNRGGGEKRAVPRDVPRGHTVLYVGESCQRFVVREYQFRHGHRLRIPCDEGSFLAVLHLVTARRVRRRRLCL